MVIYTIYTVNNVDYDSCCKKKKKKKIFIWLKQ